MSEGKWVTIKGRRVFIGEGESLSTAMAKSGKFKKDTKKKEDKKEEFKYVRQSENPKHWEKQISKLKSESDKQITERMNELKMFSKDIGKGQIDGYGSKWEDTMKGIRKTSYIKELDKEAQRRKLKY